MGEEACAPPGSQGENKHTLVTSLLVLDPQLLKVPQCLGSATGWGPSLDVALWGNIQHPDSSRTISYPTPPSEQRWIWVHLFLAALLLEG